jgi:VanZ family protein
MRLALMRYQRQCAKPVTKPLAIIASYQIRVLFWVAVVVLFYLALMPADDVEPIMLVSDKLAHFIAFLGLGTLGSWSYPQSKLWVVLGLILYGAIIEVAQSLTSSRAAEWADLIADSAGVLCSLFFFRLRHYFVKASS